MSSERAIEITGDTIEDAIKAGLSELGVGPHEVIIEVLEEPVRGVFGLGSRPARVRLQMLSAPKPAGPPPPSPAPVISEPITFPTPPPMPSTPVEAPKAERPPRAAEQEERPRGPRPERRDRLPRTEQPDRRPRPAESYNPAADVDVGDDDDAVSRSLFSQTDEITSDTEMDEEAVVGRVVLNELLEKMGLHARIVVRRAQPSRENESAPYILDVTGGDLTHLIGRRGETLASLQYVTRLITSRELQRRANIIVDVDSYKARRARMLHSLALRMAEQALAQGRTVQMEPMPPHERRIIHLALREHAQVVTKSIGEGTARKVTIVPKEST